MDDKHRREIFFGGLSVERNKTREVFDMPQLHSHNYHELYFLLSGARQYFIGHTIYHVSPGDLVVIPKNELHRTTNYRSSGHERFVAYFPENHIKCVRESAGEAAFEKFLTSGCIQLPAAQSEKVKRLFIEMERELSSEDPYALLVATGKLNEILICALRHGTPKLREEEKTTDRIQKVARYISENYANPITLHEAAQMAYMEDTYFSRRFKQLTGFNFVEYLTQVRIKTAAEMLLGTSLSVTKIAEHCGFSGSNYFGDVFRRIKGASPLEYRKRFSK